VVVVVAVEARGGYCFDVIKQLLRSHFKKFSNFSHNLCIMTDINY